jgi:hypothetical protein
MYLLWQVSMKRLGCKTHFPVVGHFSKIIFDIEKSLPEVHTALDLEHK